MLSEEQVRHIAKLARLTLTEQEVQKFSEQLSSILTYVEQLKEVDTTGVEPTSQVTNLQNVIRPDVAARFCEPDALLACTELPIQDRQIRVKPVITQ